MNLHITKKRYKNDQKLMKIFNITSHQRNAIQNYCAIKLHIQKDNQNEAQTIPSVCKDMVQREISCVSGVSLNSHPTNHSALSSSANHTHVLWLRNSTPRHLPKRNKDIIHRRYVCKGVFSSTSHDSPN